MFPHILTLLLLIATTTTTLVAATTTTTSSSCEASYKSCGAGCYNENGLVLHDDGLLLLSCKPVGQGHYSPTNDNERHVCPSGTFSNQDHASECVTCPAGSMQSETGQTSCQLCPVGFYQELPGKSGCKECHTGYSGEGSNDFFKDESNQKLLCALTKPIKSTHTTYRAYRKSKHLCGGTCSVGGTVSEA